MARTVGIGIQSFEKIRESDNFYVDKTGFIKEWWENGDDVTLITRPRRFGKTLMMDMLNRFFSVFCQDGGGLFEGLSIWREEKYRKLQGTYPVIFLSFAGIKETSFAAARKQICQSIKNLYNRFEFLLEGDYLREDEKKMYQEVSAVMENYVASESLKNLSEYLFRYYGKRAIILLDEYDTPMQEAISYAGHKKYVNGYWGGDDRLYQEPVQLYVQGEPVPGAGGDDGNHKNQ